MHDSAQDRRERQKQHPQPTLSPVQSAVGFVQSRKDSTATNGHTRTDAHSMPRFPEFLPSTTPVFGCAMGLFKTVSLALVLEWQ